MDEGFKVETHCHTTSSDGKDTPETIVLEARRKKLDVIAITDHDTFRGSILGERAVKMHGLDSPVVIHGNEVRTSRGDVLLLCGKPISKTSPDPWELRDIADENNCILIAAHPYSFFEPSVGNLVKDEPDLFDAIEVWNATNIPYLNRKAWKTAKKLGKPMTAGSDAHVKEEIESAYTLVYADDRNPESILEAIRKGYTKPVKGVPTPWSMIVHASWSIVRRL